MTIDPGELNELIAALDHPDKPILRAAVDRLIALAASSTIVRDALNCRLSEAGHKNYWPAAYVLGHQPQPSGAAIRTLLEALDHREPDIRWANALLLIAIGQRQSAVLPLLIEICDGGSANQRRMALYCLRDLNLHDSVSRAAMLKALDDGEPTVRVAAVTSLKTRSDVDAAARQKLLNSYLHDGDDRVKHAAAVTLASLGTPEEDFLRALQEACASANQQIKKSAMAALQILQK